MTPFPTLRPSLSANLRFWAVPIALAFAAGFFLLGW